MSVKQIEYGRFSDPSRTYVVTSSSMPDTIRVFATQQFTFRVCDG